MYKVLLVDDEEVVREGIAHNIDWDRHGFALVGACANGRDAADAMVALHPDLVITDICMPFGDGLALAEFIARRFPATKVILLTGFNDFAYAQRAVKLNAYDYILKPITAKELRELLDKARADLDAERARLDEVDRMRKRLGESSALLRERLVVRLLAGGMGEQELHRQLSDCRLPAVSCWSLVAIDLDGSLAVDAGRDLATPIRSDSGSDDLDGGTALEPPPERWPQSATHEEASGPVPGGDFKRLALASLCRELVDRAAAESAEKGAEEGAAAAATDADGRVLLLVTGEAPAETERRALAAAAAVQRATREQLRCGSTAGVGSIVETPAELPVSYRDSLFALDHRFILGADRVISWREAAEHARRLAGEEHEGEPAGREIREAEQRLLQAIKTGTNADCLVAVDGVIDHMRHTFVTSRRAYLTLHRLLARIAETCEELRIDGEELLAPDGTDPFVDLFTLSTLEEISVRLKSLCTRISDLLGRMRLSYSQIKAQQAQELIAQHYGDPRLSLHALCRDLGVSLSHFSMIFKEATGRTFTEYLTAVRLEQAMLLLKTTTMKAYEIAQAVGYADQHYFSIIFKKETGVSPIQYREKFVPAAR